MSEQTKHSPGPWKAYPYDCCPGNWYFVAGLPGLGKPDVHLDEANAHLIAAAPDLLAALESIVYGWKEMDIDGRRQFMVAARVSILKAKGQL